MVEQSNVLMIENTVLQFLVTKKKELLLNAMAIIMKKSNMYHCVVVQLKPAVMIGIQILTNEIIIQDICTPGIEMFVSNRYK
jgi:hypothetical protein